MVHYHTTLKRVLQVVADLTEEQLNWHPNITTPSIAFHLWHLARWADHLQATIPGMTGELSRRLGPGRQHWESENVAAAWGWETTQLGFEETGMRMDPADMSELQFPKKDLLVEYARQVFATANEVLQAVDDGQWLEREREKFDQNDRSALGPIGTVGSAIVVHLAHSNRHLGMIECLRGMQGMHGSATS
jgi:hypothetical protein